MMDFAVTALILAAALLLFTLLLQRSAKRDLDEARKHLDDANASLRKAGALLDETKRLTGVKP